MKYPLWHTGFVINNTDICGDSKCWCQTKNNTIPTPQSLSPIPPRNYSVIADGVVEGRIRWRITTPGMEYGKMVFTSDPIHRVVQITQQITNVAKLVEETK